MACCCQREAAEPHVTVSPPSPPLPPWPGPAGVQTTLTFKASTKSFDALYERLRRRQLDPELRTGLWMIVQNIRDRNYAAASDVYWRLAIGNSPWPIGVTQVGGGWGGVVAHGALAVHGRRAVLLCCGCDAPRVWAWLGHRRVRRRCPAWHSA